MNDIAELADLNALISEVAALRSAADQAAERSDAVRAEASAAQAEYFTAKTHLDIEVNRIVRERRK